MNKSKIIKNKPDGKEDIWDGYDHYIAIDWSIKVMAIARLTPRWKEPRVLEVPTDIRELKMFLGHLDGKKIVTFEETTPAHWLYTELCELVDRIIICDPYRNRLLSDGPKTDKIDSGKLCLLLRAGLLKEVYHSTSTLYEIRRLVSAYDDIIKVGVQMLNQKKSFQHAEGYYKMEDSQDSNSFVFEQLLSGIQWYIQTKKAYETKFKSLCNQNRLLRNQLSIPGIGEIGAVKIVGNVVDAHRFPRSGHYLSYCGLVKLKKLSGQRCYGKRQPRYNRTLKSVYKTAAMVAIKGNNPIKDYYQDLLVKGVAEHNARNAVARYIARISYGMLKNGETYQPYRWREKQP